MTSDALGQQANLFMYDPNTGSCLTTYKGSTTVPHSLTFLGDSFMVSGQPKAPLLNVWALNRHEQRSSKVSCYLGILVEFNISKSNLCLSFYRGNVTKTIIFSADCSGIGFCSDIISGW